MSTFTQATDRKEIDAIRAQLPPPRAEVGQVVYWNRTWAEIFTGRIQRIEIGTARDGGHSWPVRRYYARSESISDARGADKSWETKHEWAHADDWTGKDGHCDGTWDIYQHITLDHDKAKKRAIGNMRDNVRDLQRRIAEMEAGIVRIESTMTTALEPA